MQILEHVFVFAVRLQHTGSTILSDLSTSCASEAIAKSQINRVMAVRTRWLYDGCGECSYYCAESARVRIVPCLQLGLVLVQGRGHLI